MLATSEEYIIDENISIESFKDMNTAVSWIITP
jgi:hypothetical protein